MESDRSRLVDAVAATGRKDAAAWLALLRYDYAAAKAAGTRDAWAKLATTFRGASALPPDQRRTEAHALIQIDEARLKIHLNSDDARAFLKSARTIPLGRGSWLLWRCSIIYEARNGDAAAVRSLLTECRSRFSSSADEYQQFDRLAKEGCLAALAQMAIDDDIPPLQPAGASGAVAATSTGSASVWVPPPMQPLPASVISDSVGAAAASVGDAAAPRASIRPSAAQAPSAVAAASTAASAAAASSKKQLGLPMRVPKGVAAMLPAVPEGTEVAAAAAAAVPQSVAAPAPAVNDENAPPPVVASSRPAAVAAPSLLPVPPAALPPAPAAADAPPQQQQLGGAASSSASGSLLPPGVTLASIAAGVKRRRTAGRMSMLFLSSLSPVKESEVEGREGDADGVSVASSKQSGGSGASSGAGSRGSAGPAAAPAAPARQRSHAYDGVADDDGDADMAVDSDDDDGGGDASASHAGSSRYGTLAASAGGGATPSAPLAPQPAVAPRPSMAPSSAPSFNTTQALVLGASTTMSSFASSGVGGFHDHQQHTATITGGSRGAAGGSVGTPSAAPGRTAAASAGHTATSVSGAGCSLSLAQLDPTVTFRQAMSQAAPPQQKQQQASPFSGLPPASAASGAVTGRSSVYVGSKRKATGMAADGAALAAAPAAAAPVAAAASPAVAAPSSAAAPTAASSAAAAAAAAPKVRFALPDYIKSFDAAAMAAARSGKAGAKAAPTAATAAAAGDAAVEQEERGRDKRRRTSKGSDGSNGSGRSRSRSRGKGGDEAEAAAAPAPAPVAAPSLFAAIDEMELDDDDGGAPAVAAPVPVLAPRAAVAAAAPAGGADAAFKRPLPKAAAAAAESAPAPAAHPPRHPQPPAALNRSGMAGGSVALSTSAVGIAPRPPLPLGGRDGGLDESADSDILNDTGDSDTSGAALGPPSSSTVGMRGLAVSAGPRPTLGGRGGMGAPALQQRRQPLPAAPAAVDDDSTAAIIAGSLGAPAPVVAAPAAVQPRPSVHLRPSAAAAAAAAAASAAAPSSASSSAAAGRNGAGAGGASSGHLHHSSSLSALIDTAAASSAAASSGSGGGGGNPFETLATTREVVVVGGRSYLKLECIGRGGSSRVYRVLGEDMVPYALKRVRLSRMDAASLATYTNEIALLRQLNAAGGDTARHIIRLVDAEVSHESRCIHIVMEHGSCDLNTLLQQERERLERDGGGPVGAPAPAGLPFAGGRALRSAAASSGGSSSSAAADAAVVRPCVDENLLRLVWQQMLHAVHAIHEARIVHGDLKPANFVFVEGTLKLIDFGIAKAISNDTTNIVRDSQVGTLNYMSPEAILDVSGSTGGGGRGGAPLLKLGRPSDIWSLGCILYQMVYGRTPFAELSLIQKLHAIVDGGHAIAFPRLANDDLMDVLRGCLTRDPSARLPIAGPAGLLAHPFLRPRGGTGGSAAQQPSQQPVLPAGAVPLSQRSLADLLSALSAAGLLAAPAAHGAGGLDGGAVDALAAALLPALATAAAEPAAALSSSSSAAPGPSPALSEALQRAVADISTLQPPPPPPAARKRPSLRGVAAAAAAAAATAAAAARPALAALNDENAPPPSSSSAATSGRPSAKGKAAAAAAAPARAAEPPRITAALLGQQVAKLRPTAAAKARQQGGEEGEGGSSAPPPSQASALRAAIQEAAAALRPVAQLPPAAVDPAASADKENAPAAAAGKAAAPAGPGLEAALRRGLQARFAGLGSAAAAGHDGDVTAGMDLTWSSVGGGGGSGAGAGAGAAAIGGSALR